MKNKQSGLCNNFSQDFSIFTTVELYIVISNLKISFLIITETSKLLILDFLISIKLEIDSKLPADLPVMLLHR